MRRSLSVAMLALAGLIPLTANAATLSIDTPKTSYGRGDTFIATVRLDNDNECVNAAQVEIDYPTNLLRAVDFSRGDSIFSLWVGDPQIDTEKGTVTFSGGVPGGYCGRIAGDPAQSNIIGEIVFTVVGNDAENKAAVNLAASSRVYLHDGLGTPAPLNLKGVTLSLMPVPTQDSNPWLAQVGDDATPPESFAVQVESTRDVFGGKYYAVFSTVDKQSGLDHYEIFEDGVWNRVSSPHVLKDQTLNSGVMIRAIDKAGNIRLGDYDAKSVPPRQYSFAEMFSFYLLLGIAVLAIIIRLYFARHAARENSASSAS